MPHNARANIAPGLFRAEPPNRRREAASEEPGNGSRTGRNRRVQENCKSDGKNCKSHDRRRTHEGLNGMLARKIGTSNGGRDDRTAARR